MRESAQKGRRYDGGSDCCHLGPGLISIPLRAGEKRKAIIESADAREQEREGEDRLKNAWFALKFRP